MELIVVVFILFIVFFSYYFRIVPPNTAIIVDRKSHFLKKKNHGFYFFNPSTDAVTTYISTTPYLKYYSQVSESHDGKLYRINYMVIYKADNINHVLERLQYNRRSIDDIIQSCVHTSASNFEKDDFNYKLEIVEEIKRRLSINLESFEISLLQFSISSATQIKESYRSELFAPHISEGIKSIKFE